jgi:hypothetical protein
MMNPFQEPVILGKSMNIPFEDFEAFYIEKHVAHVARHKIFLGHSRAHDAPGISMT